jgi:hypothetical protein
MRSDLSLRIALLTNAALPAGSALLLLVAPDGVSRWLGVAAPPRMLQIVGIGLVVFAADLVHQATRRRLATWRALYASTGDFLWVAGTVALLAAFPHAPSRTGTLLLLAIAALVLVFGLWQLRAIAQAHRISRPGHYRHCVVVAVNVPAGAMWRVVSDLGGIMHYLPTLMESELVGGATPGVGATRVCVDRAGRRWTEQCTEFNAGRNFTVRFVCEAPDFPFPARAMRGGWDVKPTAWGCDVTVWWELAPKHPLLAPLLLPLLALQADRTFPRVVERMAICAVGRTGKLRPRRGERVIARLRPVVC